MTYKPSENVLMMWAQRLFELTCFGHLHLLLLHPLVHQAFKREPWVTNFPKGDVLIDMDVDIWSTCLHQKGKALQCGVSRITQRGIFKATLCKNVPLSEVCFYRQLLLVSSSNECRCNMVTWRTDKHLSFSLAIQAMHYGCLWSGSEHPAKI